MNVWRKQRCRTSLNKIKNSAFHKQNHLQVMIRNDSRDSFLIFHHYGWGLVRFTHTQKLVGLASDRNDRSELLQQKKIHAFFVLHLQNHQWFHCRFLKSVGMIVVKRNYLLRQCLLKPSTSTSARGFFQHFTITLFLSYFWKTSFVVANNNHQHHFQIFINSFFMFWIFFEIASGHEWKAP